MSGLIEMLNEEKEELDNPLDKIQEIFDSYTTEYNDIVSDANYRLNSEMWREAHKDEHRRNKRFYETILKINEVLKAYNDVSEISGCDT